LLNRHVDYAWATTEDLLGYASAYLEDLATGMVPPGDGALAGYDPKIVRIRARLSRYADINWPVMLVGERGTGKGHLLRAITRLTGRLPITVPLATISESVAESEIFGHTKGAFTGADKARAGIILTAHLSRSAIFLDDVGECPPTVQVKLLTVLDDGILRPVGSDEMVSVGRGAERRFGVYSASQPESLVKLRPDLRDRLATIVVDIPPLRERGIDVLLLADRFLRKVSADEAAGRKTLSAEARVVLLDYEWPGNVRQLKSVIVRAVFEAQDRAVLDAGAVKASLQAEPDIPSGSGHHGASPEGDSTPGRFPTMAEMTDRHFRAALDRSGGNVSAAARLLKLHRSTIHAWMRRGGQAEASVGQDDG